MDETAGASYVNMLVRHPIVFAMVMIPAEAVVYPAPARHETDEEDSQAEDVAAVFPRRMAGE